MFPKFPKLFIVSKKVDGYEKDSCRVNFLRDEK